MDRKRITIVLFIYVIYHTSAVNDKCFCQLSGQIDDCFCDIETLETFNNEKVFPLVQKLVHQDFFKYYKVNLFKSCNYFDGNTGLCESENCGVKTCSDEELPVGMRNSNLNEINETLKSKEDCSKAKSIGDVNGTLSNTTMDFLGHWDKHDNTVYQFCDLDDETSNHLEYIDLIANPERFTGYEGPMAWRIWTAIYEENCFRAETISKNSNPMFQNARTDKFNKFVGYTSSELQGMCLEKRVFYRVISGLHTSINTHLCAFYLLEAKNGEEKWGPNLAEFQRRFDPTITNGEGTARLKNLYFIYLLELRALSKVAPYFNRPNFHLYTGRDEEDKETKEILIQLLNITGRFPMHFDEGIMFQDRESKNLKKEFVDRFLNVTRIIDCVTCEKCRLWGKLQTQGLGTALKILFSIEELNEEVIQQFRLQRQEVVSLINGFARLSESIKFLETFRVLIKEKNKLQYGKGEL